MTPELHDLLMQFDEVDAFEFPSTLNRKALERSARQVSRELSIEGIPNHFEDWQHNQDAIFGLHHIVPVRGRVASDLAHEYRLPPAKNGYELK